MVDGDGSDRPLGQRPAAGGGATAWVAVTFHLWHMDQFGCLHGAGPICVTGNSTKIFPDTFHAERVYDEQGRSD